MILPRHLHLLCILLITLLAYFSAAVQASAYVMGEDDRRPLTDREKWRYQSVGVIAAKWSLEDKLRRIGTAVIVSSAGGSHDIIVTTAHNFIHHLSGRPHGNEFYFLTNRGEVIRVLGATLGRSFSSTDAVTLSDATKDWAIALLETPISREYGALGVGIIDHAGLQRAHRSDRKIFAIGYDPADRSLRISDKCSAFQLRLHIGIIHDCDTKPGWSGGPLVMIDAGKPWVIGISTLQVTEKRKRHRAFDPNRHYNVAAPIDRALRDRIIEMGRTGRLRGDHVMRFFEK